jgi:hypothetical protein
MQSNMHVKQRRTATGEIGPNFSHCGLQPLIAVNGEILCNLPKVWCI